MPSVVTQSLLAVLAKVDDEENSTCKEDLEMINSRILNDLIGNGEITDEQVRNMNYILD